MLSAAQPTCLLIADISGTPATSPTPSSTTRRTSSPISSVPWSRRSDPKFRLAKHEGDAAFTFQTVDRVDGSMLATNTA